MTALLDWKNPDYEPVYAGRRARLAAVREDPANWDKLFQFYKTHPVEAIEDWVVTFDPRKVGKGRAAYMPFVLFPKQKEFILWMHERFQKQEEGIVEKSRDMGASWLALTYAWWLWTFHPGSKISFASRVERDVDRLKDPDSLFGKFRIIVERLPYEMRPLGWNDKEDCPYLRLINRENGNIISGEAGKQIGRGGRSTICFIDEAAFLEDPEDADRALSMNAECKIWISTSNGEGNPFYRKRFSGNFPVFTFHWTDDPRKDQEWYDQKKITMAPEDFAREVEIDYAASGRESVVPAAHIRSSQQLRALMEAEGTLPDCDKDGIAGFDVAGGGNAKNVIVARHGPVVSKSVSWSTKEDPNLVEKAAGATRGLNCNVVNYDSIGVGYYVADLLRGFSDIRCNAVNVGEKASRRIWPDRKTARNKFVDMKAELWWGLREKLRMTHEHLQYMRGEGDQKHDISDLLLLPDNDPDLCSQLSLPSWEWTASGRIQIESKNKLKHRGIPSPDHADALVLTEATAMNRHNIIFRTTGHV